MKHKKEEQRYLNAGRPDFPWIWSRQAFVEVILHLSSASQDGTGEEYMRTGKKQEGPLIFPGGFLPCIVIANRG
ncbi:MAG: hypothetical protein PHG91_02580 [Syntrophales bacterium]|nr:hypothetical protein [Syntrophales bacterium]MDD5531764.1 hypothetical protein [Syntrophales bacterium]